MYDHYQPTIKRREYQLVGVASLFIASKYEEVYPPLAQELR